MAEDPFDSERPHDEAWWERELHRNEKLMDKYMAVLGDNPDWDKWKNPEDLYNKVHFNIDPPERPEGEKSEDDDDFEAFEAESDEKDVIGDEGFAQDLDEISEDEMNSAEGEDPDDDPHVNEDYEAVAKTARDFACRVFDLDKLPGNAELLYLSAGKVGANLAGGHGLGYDDEFICGNIVKCRWALSDCEFCREMLEQLYQKTSETVYGELTEESRRLADLVRDRIARLRKRVWW